MNLNKCRLCAGQLYRKPLLRLEGMPKAAQYYPQKNEFRKDKGITLNVYQCFACGLVQLDIKPVNYFREVITAASFSDKAKLTRLTQMKEFINKFGLNGKKVLEIGSGEGNMLDILKEAGVCAIGLEAALKSVRIARLAGRNVVHGYIGDINRIDGSPFDAFVSLNYLEHLPNPGGIIRKIYNNTSANGAGFVTVPNFDYLLETKCFYEFVADHLSYFTQKTLAYAFESNGFEVLGCNTINNNNDIAVQVQKRKIIDIAGDYKEVNGLIKDLQQIAADYKVKNKKIAVWGAGHRTLALLALSKLDNVEYVVDSAKFKQSKFTPISHFDIVPPEHLKKSKVDLVIVMLPGLYPGEVLKTLTQMNVGADVAVLRQNKIEFI